MSKNNELKEIIKSDMYRYHGDKKMSLYKIVYEKLFTHQIGYLKIYRKYKYYKEKNIFKSFFYAIKLHHMENKYHFQIGIKATIGKGFRIDHFGRIIINPNTVIGKNCTIATGVTIGHELRGKRKGCPIIGDEVWIGANVVIVGKINIGNNVLIAPNSFVNFDVPDNSIVIGNPGKIIYKEKATDGYIINKID